MSAPVVLTIRAVIFFSSCSVNPCPDSSRSRLWMPHRSILAFGIDISGPPLNCLLDFTKTGAVRFFGTTPVASEIKNMRIPEGRCIPVLRLPVFDTTPPGVGGRLKPRCARHGNFTPPRIAPSRPSGREYHCVLTRSLRNSLSAVSGQMGTARRLIWPSLMGKPHRRVLAHPPGSLARQGTYFGRRM